MYKVNFTKSGTDLAPPPPPPHVIKSSKFVSINFTWIQKRQTKFENTHKNGGWFFLRRRWRIQWFISFINGRHCQFSDANAAAKSSQPWISGASILWSNKSMFHCWWVPIYLVNNCLWHPCNTNIQSKFKFAPNT